MALSKYTYRLDNGDTVYFMNGISEEFFKVEKEKADKVEYLLKTRMNARKLSLRFTKRCMLGIS